MMNAKAQNPWLSRRLWAWILVGAAFFSGTAHAGDGNILVIEQTGVANQLTVDQSKATRSRVLGAAIGPSGPTFQPITQPEELVDQSDGPRVFPVYYSPQDRAFQGGTRNTADITVSGSGGTVRLFQNNVSAGSAALGNAASITLSGNGVAIVGQQGDANKALLSVSGAKSGGSILQLGNGNRADLSVSTGATALISQEGNNNSSGQVSIQGSEANVTYIQRGDGLQPVNPARGLTVSTNAGTVTIQQSTVSGR